MKRLNLLIPGFLLVMLLGSCSNQRDSDELKAKKFQPELFQELEAFALTIDLDGKTFYVTAAQRDGGGLYKSERTNNKWQPLEKLEFSSGEFNDNDLFPSPDGSGEYFFMTKRDDPEKEQNIWVVEKNNGIWENMKGVANVNSEERDGFPSVNLNGDLYFFSQREGGFGSADIYRSQKIDRQYSQPENLGESINSEHWDGLPYISPNGKVMIFFSDRPGGYGEGDLYVSYLNDGKWSDPENLGSNVNSSGTDVTPFIGPEKKYLYFTRVEAIDSTHRRSIYYVELENTPIKLELLNL